MSEGWKAYVKSLQDHGMKHGAICGIKGDWIEASDGSNITLDECKVIIANYAKDTMTQTGIKLGGVKYMYLSSDKETSPYPIRVKKGSAGAHVVKSNTTMMIGIYDDPMKAGEAAVAVEKVVSYLIGNNC